MGAWFAYTLRNSSGYTGHDATPQNSGDILGVFESVLRAREGVREGARDGVKARVSASAREGTGLSSNARAITGEGSSCTLFKGKQPL